MAPDTSSTLDRLGHEIAELSAHLDAATAHLLDLIREFDARGGWNTGFLTCAAWLTWRVGLDPGAARERVRVARALGTLPRLAQALSRGELSYAKVRAGRAGTAAHVERIVGGWRRVDRLAETRETARRHRSRALHVYQDEDGMMIVRGRLAPEVGALLVQALAAARERLYQQARATDAARSGRRFRGNADGGSAAGGRAGMRRGSRSLRMAASWRSAPGPGPFLLRSGACSITATGVAASRAAAVRSVRVITSPTGPTAGRPRSRTWRCSVAGTIAQFTRRVTRWSDSPTAN